jgi:indolepyruvate ferredoxin oxidoreductase
VLGCDLVVAAGFEALSKIAQGATRAVINSQETVTGDFTRNPDLVFPAARLKEMIGEAAGPGGADFIDASRMATALMGDSIATNLFMLGYAWQKGLLPIAGEALIAAIELNGVAVEANKRAFEWGRRAAHDPAAVAAVAQPAKVPASRHLSQSLEETVARRVEFLTAYQNAAYGERYRALVARIEAAERERTPGMKGLAEAVARYYFKLLAVKDEYEVARLYAAPEFTEKLKQQFEGAVKLSFHLAPPLLARRDPASGHLKKAEFGGWMMPAFRVLARLKGLRGTPFDIFGYGAERRLERRLIADYEALIAEVIAGLGHDNHALAVELASIPEKIRGFGHVKQAHLKAAKACEADLIAHFRNPETTHRDAAE